MAIEFYYGSGSPYGWRVWLALEHKQLPYRLHTLSFSAGDLRTPQFLAINPRGKIPAIVDGGFALWESAAIVEYLEERYPGRDGATRLFPVGIGKRATVRRMICEIDAYFAVALERLVQQILFTAPEQRDTREIAAARQLCASELGILEERIPSDFLTADVGAADFALYPLIALGMRLDRRYSGLEFSALVGPIVGNWMRRVESLPYFAATYPPHWKQA